MITKNRVYLEWKCRYSRFSVLVCRTAVVLFSAMVLAAQASSAQAVSAEGLKGRVIVGYQGWFGCPNDFEDNKVWQHWFVKGVSFPQKFVFQG